MRKKLLSMLIIVAMMIQILGISSTVYAEPGIFAGGSGTEGNPFQISTEAQLVAFRDSVTLENRYFDQYVVLTNDITITTPWENESIGNDQSDGFAGNFSGNGYSIINFTLDASLSNKGLFGYLAAGGKIQRLAMTNVTITATEDSYYIGAIVGENQGVIENCYVTGNLSRNAGTGYNLGGIVGTNYGEFAFIRNCYTDVTINGFNVIGGIAGNNNNGTIVNSFSLGTVSYAAGYENAQGAQRGAIAGYITENSVQTKNYYLNNQSESVTAVANFTNSVADDDNYNIDVDSTYKTVSFFNDVDSWDGTYPWDFVNVWTTDGDSGYPMLIPSEVSAPTGDTWQGFAATELTGTGAENDPYEIGTAEELAYLAKQVNTGEDYDNTYFVLTADIDLSDHEWIPIGGWDADNNEAANYQFLGTFDGDGHTISGMKIGSESTPNNVIQYVGLFGYVGSGSSIYDVNITEATIYSTFAENDVSTDGSYVGVLVGYSEGTIESCHVAGTIECGSSDDTWLNVGGLVGLGSGSQITNTSAEVAILTGYIENDLLAGGLIGKLETGSISNSWSTGNVEIGGINSSWSWGMAGGFVGYSSAGDSFATIFNCFATGDVTGADGIDVGGFAGRIESGEVDNCYARGNVTGNDDAGVGGFVGYPYEGYIQNCYASGNTTGGNASDVGGFNGDYDDASIWDCYFNEDATQMVDGFPVTPAVSTEANTMTETIMKSDTFLDTLNDNISTIETFEGSPEMSFSTWFREDGTNDGYPTFSIDTNEAFNPLSNAVEGNYTIVNGEDNSIAPGTIPIPNGMVTVTNFLNNLTIEEGCVYKVLPKSVADEIEDYSDYDVATAKGGNAVLVNNDVLIVYSGDHSQTIKYKIITDETGNKINNGKLRFGNGDEESINTKGGLQQPFYYNDDWYKLTYQSLPLNYALGIEGVNNGNWNSAGTISIDSVLNGLVKNYSGLSHGSGIAQAVGTVTINEKQFEITNTYTLGENASFIKITTTLKNLSEETVSNVRYWTGTTDDWIGNNDYSDSPTKTKGNLVEGAFVGNTANDQQAKALKIESGSDTVLFFSTHPTTEMLITGRSMNTLTTTDPRTNAFTGNSDQAYALFANLGDLASEESASFEWYYAAGTAADIGDITSDIGNDVTESNNADLSNIILSNGSLTPSFDASTVSYSASVANDVSSITVTPTVDDGLSTVTVNGSTVTSGQPSGALNLNVGSNTITIVVTAQDHTTKTYTITVTRAAASGSSGGSGGSTTPQPSQDTVIVIVNGEQQNAGTETKTTEDGKSIVAVEVNNNVIESKIDDAIKNNPTGIGNILQIPVSDTKADVVKVELTGDMVKKLETNKFDVSIKRDNVEYVIPAKELTISNVAKELGVSEQTLKDIKIEVQITKLDDSVTAKYNEVAKANGAELVFPPVAFEIVAKTTKADGTTADVAINKFSNYVERVMEIPDGVDPSKITTGIVFNPDGTYSHVPTEVFQKEGKWYAKLNSLTNSNYSVIWNPITVKSVENHWSKDAVNDMASRLVVFNAETFAPDKAITRADFAEYIVRALGLYREGSKHENKFKDVSENGNRTLAVLMANEYGIVAGYPDGTFRPDALITREEAMVMYQRAMKVTKLTGNDTNRYQNYTDYSKVSDWATSYVKEVLSAHVFNGTTVTKISPKSNLTYAEAAQAIKNLLVESKLINK